MDENEAKKRARSAIEKYLKKQEPREMRKNKSPEADLVKESLPLLRSLGWDLEVVESKSTFSPTENRWIQQNVRPGFPDTVGATPCIFPAWVEWKAPGKRSTIRTNQYDFLKEKIHKGHFAVCVDSNSLLIEIHSQWKSKSPGSEAAKQFLLDVLPEPYFKDEEELSFFD